MQEKDISSVAGRAMTTMSKVIPASLHLESGFSSRNRSASRSRRRARFRATAPLIWRLTPTPTRFPAAARPGAAKPTIAWPA